MTILRHGLSESDRAAMAAFRARLASNQVAITRDSYDALLERVPAADSVCYSDATIGGVYGMWCAPSANQSQAAILYLHGGVFVYGTAHAYRHFAGQIAAHS